MHGRLRFARKAAKLTLEELAERVGYKVNTVKKHEQRNKFDRDAAERYGRATGHNWLWIMHKEGSPTRQRGLTISSDTSARREGASRPSVVSLVSIREIDVYAGAGGGGEMPAAYDQLPDGSWVPTDAVAAEVMFPESWLVSMGLDPNRTDLVRVKGDSMSPEIEDGDWVFVDRRVHHLQADDIYLIFDGFGIVVKSLAIVRAAGRENPRVRILSANSKYPPEEVPAADVVIIGRVHFRIGRIVRGRY